MRSLLSAIAPPACVACGACAGRLEPLCRDCRAELRWLGREAALTAGIVAWAPLAYEGPARAMVRALKFRGALSLAGSMASQMVATAPPGLFCGGTELVPVPLHPARRRRRGFNQAERLAHALGCRRGLSVRDCLERAGTRTPQVGRARSDRLVAIEGSVRLREGATAPVRALIVDDVVTTGATLRACADALRRAGARQVAAVAYARTPGR